MRKYILGIILTVLIALSGVFNSDTQALDNDYKNNLLKVDVAKVNDGTYKIDLYTQKPYSEPIRVRKKSDTSYYVLLPETYHSITSVGSTGDVDKVDVKLYPYAGQDLNNGYTKINIQTTKPVTFTTNIKTASNQMPSIDSKKLAQLDNAFENKPSYKPAPVEVKAQAPKTTAQTKAAAPVKETAPAQTAPVQVQKKAVDTTRIASHSSSSEIEIVTKPKVEPKPVQTPQRSLQAVDSSAPANLEEVVDPDVRDNDSVKNLEEEAKEQGLTEENVDEDTVPVVAKKGLKHKIKTAVKYGMENFLLLLAIVLLVVAVVLLLSPKAKQEPKQKPAPAPVLDDTEAQEPVVAAVAETTETEAAPAQTTEGYDVYEAHVEPAPGAPAPVEASAPAEEAPTEESGDDEADVLATESFGDGKGLCLVNFNGSIALVGYIGEEIFVIQNFGKITLINPNIQVRVAEQNDEDTIYIVKAANSKLMVKETKTFIGLEMVM